MNIEKKKNKYVEAYLLNNHYYYYKQTNLFIYYDGNNYTFISEDDLLFKILNNVSNLKMTENKQLIQKKQEIKDEIMNKIMKNDITTSIIGLDQIIESYKLVDDFNISISGNGIGKGNCILPLYIDEKHWELVKIYQNYNFGLLFNRNPLLYCNDMVKIYKIALVKMISLTFSDVNYLIKCYLRYR